MLRIMKAVALLALVGCTTAPTPTPMCDGVREHCGVEHYFARCVGGFSGERPGELLPGTEDPTCDAAGNLTCAGGETPYCERDPFADPDAGALEGDAG